MAFKITSQTSFFKKLLRDVLHKTQFVNPERSRYKKHKNKRSNTGRSKRAPMLMVEDLRKGGDESKLDQMGAVITIPITISFFDLSKLTKDTSWQNKITQNRTKKKEKKTWDSENRDSGLGRKQRKPRGWWLCGRSRKHISKEKH